MALRRTQLESHDDGGAGGHVSGVYAFSADPRGGGRAYYVDDGTLLWQTQDSGATWSLIPTPAPDSGCGGIPNVHAVQPPVSLTQFKLYYGNRCTTYVVTVTVTVTAGAEPSSVVTTGDWAALDAGHPDTRDLAFHPSTEAPYLISSDGGRAGGRSDHVCHGRRSVARSRRPGDARGRWPVPPGSADPDLYFATWHDFIWSMDGTSPNPVGYNNWEGGYLGMSRIVNAGERNRLTFTNQAAPEVSDRRFTNGGLWPNAPNAMGSPTFLSPGRYVQPAQDGVGHQWEIKYTASEGAAGSWRTIANIGRQTLGNPYVAGPQADPTLVQPYLDGTVADPSSPHFGKDIVHLVSLSGFSHGGSAHPHWPWLATIRQIHAAGSGLGGLGVVTSSGFWYEVLAVDPDDPARMIAPDVIHGDMRMTTGGGDTWSVIPGVVGQITHAGQYSFTQPAGNDIAPQASAISFCPDNDSRVLMGTRQGSAWFSSDGGQTWEAVPDSDRVTLATSIFWLRGCSGAYIATDGRGLWRVDVAVQRTVNGSCAPPVCHVLATTTCSSTIRARPPSVASSWATGRSRPPGSSRAGCR